MFILDSWGLNYTYRQEQDAKKAVLEMLDNYDKLIRAGCTLVILYINSKSPNPKPLKEMTPLPVNLSKKVVKLPGWVDGGRMLSDHHKDFRASSYAIFSNEDLQE